MCRGKLNLGLLPSSSMHLTFSGDDGYSEQLALLNNSCDFSEAVIEEIPADTSGRSFEIKISQSKVYYYWCAEKSKEHGMELLTKTKSQIRHFQRWGYKVVMYKGQAYLVSCGPISSTVPLLPSLNPLLPETESLVERSARETLMRLIASTPSASTAQLANILPVVVPDFPENVPRVHNVNKNIVATNCCIDMFGCGIGAMELRSDDEAPREDESHATSAYDDTSDDCNMELHFQEH
ncbi:hypothetical protein PR202_gb11950 [Eleusine coracana subsp. coracana]|uniref:Uncharacterized protein n=1 Tax=Eleusine coracana subsp. coracana TaxID=191504 RepID=A0AAV5ELS5_ELECO|nr:hypothetical protein PR202_gb11950 [Eleusine coracana subsp. coracana]